MASNNPEETLSDATEEVHSCANCGKDVDDQQPCYRCINAPDITGEPLPTTWFCSLHCQMENQRAHIAACRAADARRTLYRAGRTCELIFQCCHEVLSKIIIARVERNGKDIYVHQASELEMQSLPPLSTLFENDDDKSAAIACIASSAAIPFARGLLEHMLPGDLLRLARIDYIEQPPPRRIITIAPDGTQTDNALQVHSILQIALKNGECSAIDITGVQFGYDNPVVPWENYNSSRIQEVRGAKRLSSLKDDHEQTNDDEVYQFVAALIEAINEWECVRWSMQHVLTGGWNRSEGAYLEWRGDLLEHIDRWVSEYVVGKEEARSAGAEGN